jgi:hypothetical protein
MTAEDFNRWLADMKAAALARSDAECARLLGISSNGLLKMKKQGTDRRTALACQALLHQMEPYAPAVPAAHRTTSGFHGD